MKAALIIMIFTEKQIEYQRDWFSLLSNSLIFLEEVYLAGVLLGEFGFHAQNTL